MKFLERDLEKIIWESDNEKLRKRGLAYSVGLVIPNFAESSSSVYLPLKPETFAVASNLVISFVIFNFFTKLSKS